MPRRDDIQKILLIQILRSQRKMNRIGMQQKYI